MVLGLDWVKQFVFLLRRQSRGVEGKKKNTNATTLVTIAYLVNAFQVEDSARGTPLKSPFNAEAISMWINGLLEEHKKKVSIRSFTPEEVKNVLKLLNANGLFTWSDPDFEELRSREPEEN